MTQPQYFSEILKANETVHFADVSGIISQTKLNSFDIDQTVKNIKIKPKAKKVNRILKENVSIVPIDPPSKHYSNTAKPYPSQLEQYKNSENDSVREPTPTVCKSTRGPSRISQDLAVVYSPA